MDCSTPGFPVHQQLPEFTQTHVHWVSDAVQPFHPLSPLLLLPSIFPSIRVFSNESALHIRWPKYWSSRFNISPSNEYPELISFRMDWLDLLAVQGLSRVISSTTVRKYQHFRLLCLSPSPWVYSKVKSIEPVIPSNHLILCCPFSSCLQSFPVSGSFQMSQFFASSGQSIGVSASASVLPMNIQDYFPLGLTGLISLLSKGLLRVFSNTTIQKHQFFGAQLSL